MKTLVYFILTLTVTAVVTAKYEKYKAKSTVKPVVSKSSISTSTVSAQCPAAYDVKASEDPGEFGKEYVSEGAKYIHCKKCDIGVFMLHENETVKTCTYCGQPQPSSVKDN